MGLFGHKNNEPTPATHAAPARQSTSSSDGSPRRGFFGRGRDPSPEYNDTRNGSKLSHGSKRSSGGLLHRNQEDPSIVDARQRVASAEAAEREADRALVQARTAVRDAREHVKRIEMEAAEEYVVFVHKMQKNTR